MTINSRSCKDKEQKNILILNQLLVYRGIFYCVLCQTGLVSSVSFDARLDTGERRPSVRLTVRMKKKNSALTERIFMKFGL